MFKYDFIYQKCYFISDDTEIDFEEFYEFIETMQDPTGELRDSFRLFDKNGDGSIDKEELKGKLKRVQLDMSMVAYEQTF